MEYEPVPGELNLLDAGIDLGAWVLHVQLRSDIFNFDFDACITAVIKQQYKDLIRLRIVGPAVARAFRLWADVLGHTGFEHRG